MFKEEITNKEAICIVITFVIGSSLILGIGGEAKNDAWLSGIMGFIMSIPLLLIYSRLLWIFQGKDLFDILTITLGTTIGKIISVLYIWYAFHLGALILRNFGEFISTIAMPETPMFVPILCLGLTCVFAVRLGIEVIGRTTTFFLPILIVIIVVVQLLAIPHLNFNYLKPVLGDGLTPILRGGFATLSFPFLESVLFLGIFSSCKTKKSPLKIYLLGIFIAAVIIIGIAIRNITMLGNMEGSFYFPSYQAVSLIDVGDFIQRIEVTVSFVFVFGVFIKASICLLVVSKGIKNVLNLHNYRSIVLQIGLLMISFSTILFDSTMEMSEWAFKVYPFYAFPMQILIPIIIWIIAEIKFKIKNM